MKLLNYFKEKKDFRWSLNEINSMGSSCEPLFDTITKQRFIIMAVRGYSEFDYRVDLTPLIYLGMKTKWSDGLTVDSIELKARFKKIYTIKSESNA
nr:MAG TPA: hypothetical protein [Caudoviricetes sp.]